MEPHTIEDWSALLGIATGIFMAIGWYLKKVLGDPLTNQMNLLSNTIKGLDDTTKMTQKDVSNLYEKFNDHEKRIYASEKELVRLEQEKVAHPQAD
ncbi:hypothetical protein H7198_06230 [Fructobacillus sp. CRL 2054]|uniref:hypothetical protein n=1 Tax=Fructobacillus sp. CRL 2054 TaxID=2763007 RepID=UPI00237883EB|nr:hypothetical protein [Fructobacillus sp. CRL 2054]MDD9139199.1 hypothetical protein [Fructobacillus sp. CRL 2054]